MKVLLLLPRRIGRVVDCGSLENYCTERYRGFESLILRQKIKGLSSEAFFFECNGSYLLQFNYLSFRIFDKIQL